MKDRMQRVNTVGYIVIGRKSSGLGKKRIVYFAVDLSPAMPLCRDSVAVEADIDILVAQSSCKIGKSTAVRMTIAATTFKVIVGIDIGPVFGVVKFALNEVRFFHDPVKACSQLLLIGHLVVCYFFDDFAGSLQGFIILGLALCHLFAVWLEIAISDTICFHMFFSVDIVGNIALFCFLRV